MPIVAYSRQNEFDLVHHSQDCRGWAVVDQAGNHLGTVADLLVNTDANKVDSILTDGGVRIPADDIALRDNRVFVRGVVHSEQYEQTRRTATQNLAANDQAMANYEEMRRNAGDEATFVPGVTRAASENESTVPIVEEQLRVGKREVEQGAAHVRTNVRETPIEQQVNLREENVRVERNPVDRPATEADFQTFQNGEIEMIERAEVPIVAKEARVVEEVIIGKEVTEREETIQTTLQSTEVDVEHSNDDIDKTLRQRTTNS